MVRLRAVVGEAELLLFREVSAAGRVTLVSAALAYHRAGLAARWADHFAETREIVASGALVQAIDYVQAQRIPAMAGQNCVSRRHRIGGHAFQTASH